MKRRILDIMMAACCMAVSFLALVACDNELDIQTRIPVHGGVHAGGG